MHPEAMKFSDSKSPCQTKTAAFLPAEACQAAQSAFVPFGSDSTVSTQEGEGYSVKMSAAFSAVSKYKDWDSLFPLSTVSSLLDHVFAQNALQFRCHWQLFPISGLASFQTEQNFIAECYGLVYLHVGDKGAVRERSLEFWLPVTGSQAKTSL